MLRSVRFDAEAGNENRRDDGAVRLRCFTVVVLEQSTLPFAAHDRAGNGVVGSGYDQIVAQSLVRPFKMIMFNKIS